MHQYRTTKPPQSVKNNAATFFPKQPCSPAKSNYDHDIPHLRKKDVIAPRQNSFNISSGESLGQRKRQSSNTLTNSKVKNQLLNMFIRDLSKRSDSFSKRLEETYNLKSTKGSGKSQNNSFNFQTSNWYMPKQKKSNKKSLDPTADVSFENTILQRGYQDFSGVYQENAEEEYNPKAIKLLEKAKGQLKDKSIDEAIENLKKCLELDPNMLEGHYFLGVGYLSAQQHSKAIQEFQTIINADAIHRKNVYLLLAISYKKINQIELAIQSLSKVIQMFPRYYDAYIYRGKLYLKQKLVDKADADFNMAISLSPQKGLGYLGKADCLRSMNNYKEAIRCYQKAIQCEQAVGNAAVLKKAITLYESQQYEEAAKDLTKLLEQDTTNSEAFYFKGLCKQKLSNQVNYQENTTDAVLCFEQSIKHNNSKKAVTRSLYEIAKIKIEQRDFYAAYHTLNRADKLDTEQQYLEKFRLFTEAVIFLMKRKFDDSFVNFMQIQLNHQLNDFLKPLFYSYRAYGHFCQNRHQKALEDYKVLMDQSDVEPCIHYNRFLCEAILKVQAGQYEKGMEFFQKAGKIYSKKMEPSFYQGVTLIHMAFKQKQDQIQYLLSGLKLLDQANSMNDSNANLYYVRSIVKAFLENYSEALHDVDLAIDKSEENVPKYYYFRGIIYGCLKQYKAAINDFQITLNLDEKYGDAYLQRAKCLFLLGETKQAFQDLQDCISLRRDDPRIHVWAGNFLFANNAIEDAIKAYQDAADFKNNAQLITLRSECYLVLGMLQKCQEDISRVFKLTKDKQFEFDKDCLHAVRQVFKDDQEIFFNESDSEQQDFVQSLQKGIQLLNLQISQKSQGRLFKQYHVYIFRGVFNFHLKKYDDSLRDFQMAKSQKELSITERRLKSKSNRSLGDLFLDEETVELTEDEEDKDLLEILEIKFNELLCMVILKQYKKAKERCKQLIENINEAKQEGLQFLLQLLDNLIKNEQKQIDYQRIICLYDEPKENLICFQVPIVFFHDLKLRLSFSLPQMTPPSLNIYFDRQLVKDIGVQFLNFNFFFKKPLSVENKPEAPWIRREQLDDIIIFTDNIQLIDDVRLETEVDQQQQPKQVEVDRKDAKNNLMLDRDVEEKLQRILERRQQ